LASTYVLHPLVQYAGMSYNFRMVVRDQGRTEVGQGLGRGRRTEVVGCQMQRRSVQRVGRSKCNTQNNQIVMYRRKYKAYIQGVRVTETGARLEHKQETIREQ